MKYYSAISKGYNELYEKEQIEKINLIKDNIELNGPILDIGSGTGFSRELFKDIMQLEPCLEMINQSKGNLICGRAENLPFKDNTFNSIISITSLHHTNIEQAIEEIRRVAKPKCRFVFSILKKSKQFHKIKTKLHQNFNLKEIEHKKDLIFIGQTY